MCFCPRVGSKGSDKILSGILSRNPKNPLQELLSGEIPKQVKKSIETFTLIQNCLKILLQSGSPSEAINLISQGPYRKILTKLYEDPERRVDDLLKLSEFAEEFSSLSSFLEEVALFSSEKEDRNKRGITLTTIHQAKGLEWDTVFLVGLYQGGLPSSKATTDFELEEERRLFYVAITRARRHLLMYFPRGDKRNRNLKPSMFLTEIQKTGTFGMVKTLR